MDRTTKTAIKKLVLKLRHELEDDVEVVLKRYGIFTDREWLAEDQIPKSDDDILQARRRMAAAIAVEEARDIPRGEATRWYIREVAFTYLNRLVGLKCLEVRGLIDEVITTRVEYGGRSLYHRDFRDAHPELAAQPDDALPAALEAACRRVTDEMVGVLFDPGSESSIVWPRHPTLRQATGLINDLPDDVWAEDEIIGWVYQFYNAEEKDRIRKRGKPQLPIEVAVINQFFTPRWVVKFLVDNTLGRLWLEMHPDSERVRAQCDYLVPEPLPTDNPQSAIRNPKFQLDPDSPINNPKAPPRRKPKHPQDIRLIDPACGTMHFGHYAFEVFQEIYRDANDHGWPIWEDAEPVPLVSGGPHADLPTDAEVPALILAHNLYGVDIDLRAVQLSALSLYMKARTAEREALKAQGARLDRTRRTTYRVNLVCADARLTNGGVRARFLKEYEDDPNLKKVWIELFREMEDIAQVGSLLRVEERFRQLLGKYEPKSVIDIPPRQGTLPGVAEPPRQLSLGEASGGEDFSPGRTLAEMMDKLRGFARDALDEADVNAQMFAVEAEKTLGLLDVLLQDYEVVVMNPPYTETSIGAQEYIDEVFPSNNLNLYTAFCERATTLIGQLGYVGTITSNTFLVRKTYRGLRERILTEVAPIVTLADLGWDVLDDAQVETSAFVFGRSPTPINATANVRLFFLRLTDAHDKVSAIAEELSALRQGQRHTRTFVVRPSLFRHLPHHAFAYTVGTELLMQFEQNTSLDPSAANAKTGIQVPGAGTYYKYFWEVLPRNIGRTARWTPLANGGDFSPFYRDNPQVIDWRGDGAHFRGQEGAYLRNERFYFLQGLTWSKRTNWLHFAHLPPGHIFSHEGNGLFPRELESEWYILAIVNSLLYKKLINMICAVHKTPGYVARLPYREPLAQHKEQLSNLSEQAHDLKAAWDSSNEICTRFSVPWLLQLAQPESDASREGLGRVLDLLSSDAPPLPPPQPEDLKAWLGGLRAIEKPADDRLQAIQAEIDEAIYDLYEITPEDRALIERELGDRPPELVWPQMEGKSDEEKRREHVRRLLSYFILQALKADPDGIVPLAGDTGEPTVLDRLREGLEGTFGAETAFRLEDDAGQVLGKSTEKWLDGDFIKWHTKLYKRRPILWHITSPKRTFGVLVYYHKLDSDTLRKVRNVYLWTLRDRLGKQLADAREAKDHKTIDRLETALDDLIVLDERLKGIIESGYDPVIDDGVKANILPLQEAEVLRYNKVV